MIKSLPSYSDDKKLLNNNYENSYFVKIRNKCK